MASLKATGLLEQANDPGLDSETVPAESRDTDTGEPKDDTKKDSNLSDKGVKEGDPVSKKEENDTRKDGGGDTNLNEQGRNPPKQKQDAQLETHPPKDIAGSVPSLSLDNPPQKKKKRTRFAKFMSGRSRPRTNEGISKTKEDKAETKRRSWSSCFCFGTGQLEDRPNPPTDKKQVAAADMNVPPQRLSSSRE